MNADLVKIENSKGGVKEIKQKKEAVEGELKDIKKKIGDLKIQLRKLDAL